MLTLNNVSENFGKFTAVENISLNMDNGLYALLAPNGAGKTTIIKMITTLLNPTEGEILYDGVNIKAMGARIGNCLVICHRILDITKIILQSSIFHIWQL